MRVRVIHDFTYHHYRIRNKSKRNCVLIVSTTLSHIGKYSSFIFTSYFQICRQLFCDKHRRAGKLSVINNRIAIDDVTYALAVLFFLYILRATLISLRAVSKFCQRKKATDIFIDFVTMQRYFLRIFIKRNNNNIDIFA